MIEFEKSFPLTTVTHKNSKIKWFDLELQNLLRNKEKLFIKYVNKKTDRSKTTLTKARNLYFNTVRIKKQTYYSMKFDKCKNDIKNT